MNAILFSCLFIYDNYAYICSFTGTPYPTKNPAGVLELTLCVTELKWNPPSNDDAHQ